MISDNVITAFESRNTVYLLVVFSLTPTKKTDLIHLDSNTSLLALSERLGPIQHTVAYVLLSILAPLQTTHKFPKRSLVTSQPSRLFPAPPRATAAVAPSPGLDRQIDGQTQARQGALLVLLEGCQPLIPG